MNICFADGPHYLNDGGTLMLANMDRYLKMIAGFDLENFEETYADLKYFDTKFDKLGYALASTGHSS